LCFIYFLEGVVTGDGKNADKYGTMAIKEDRYNAKALVNKGNCEMHKAKLREEKNHFDSARELYNNAKELYMEGIGVEADCVEAIFNLGLCCRHMARLEYAHGNVKNYKQHIRAALQAFEKVSLFPSTSPVASLSTRHPPPSSSSDSLFPLLLSVKLFLLLPHLLVSPPSFRSSHSLYLSLSFSLSLPPPAPAAFSLARLRASFCPCAHLLSRAHCSSTQFCRTRPSARGTSLRSTTSSRSLTKR